MYLILRTPHFPIYVGQMIELLLNPILLAAIDLQQIIYSVILGIVQGISEWLPISSKTQIIIVSTYLLHLNFNEAYTFGLFMEIGTILAALIYFRREYWSLIRVLFSKGNPESRKLFNYVVVSTIITGIIGAPLYLIVDSLNLDGSYNLGIPLLIMGVILIGDALLIKYSRSKYANQKNRRSLKDMSLKDYVFVGIAQGIAALPGVSRSGATTSTLLLSNLEAQEAFRLSFIDMIFATGAAVVLTYLADRTAVLQTVGLISTTGLVISIIVATIISLLLIDFLLKEARKSRIIWLTAALGIIALAAGSMALIFGVV